MHDFRVGIDVGGTFTDVVALKGGRLLRRKIRSTPEDFSAAVLEGLALLLQEEGAPGERVREVIHATTVAANAIIEKKGARVGLITTKGFRDVLEIGRLRTPRLYDISWRKPRPLVERGLRLEVAERVMTDGTVDAPLDEEDLRRAVTRLLDKGVRSIAVCFINSFANTAHERRAGELIRAWAPEVSLSLSHEVLPELREFERTSTTVINAYVRPVVDSYLGLLEQGLGALGIEAPLLLMQSSGGAMSTSLARARPIHIVESGPAAGVMGAQKLAQRTGHRSVISFDMGGTTAKVATIEDGQVSRHPEYEVGGEMSMGHHLLKGGGYLLRVPAIELAEVGSGGGSIAWIDKGGVLQVGPQSAGAQPGPVCYGTGGTDPTVTDANVVLGYLNPYYLVGGALALDADAARKAIEARLARVLGVDAVHAAYGIYLVANARMIRAVHAVTSEKGRSPADFALFTFGGSGPVHAAEMARQLGIDEVVIPPAPGLFSALGLLFSDMEHHYVQTFWRHADRLDCEEANAYLRSLEAQGTEALHHEGYSADRIEMRPLVDMRYVGQNFELTVPLDGQGFTPRTVAGLVDGFHREHERTFGYRSEERVQMVNLRVIARGVPSETRMPDEMAVAEYRPTDTSRRVYLGPQRGWVATPIVGRTDLSLTPVAGPLIVEEYDSTILVPPETHARLDRWGNVVLSLS